MEKVFRWGKNTLALVPGFTLMFFNLWIPLEIPRLLLAGIIQAVGVFTLLVFHQKKVNLKKKPSAYLIKRSVWSFTLFMIFLMGYIVIFDNQNIYNSKYDTTILIPFCKSDNLNYMLIKAGGVNNAISTYGPEAIRKVISDTTLALSTTKILFLINYILIFEFLVIGFTFIALNIEKLTIPKRSIRGK